jgi:hypothetical protein
MTIKLLGSDASSGSNEIAGLFRLTKWTAVATGNMTEFKFVAGASGNVKCALYADNSGAPGALITAMETGQAVSSGANTLTFTSTPITVSTDYWLGICFDNANVGQYGIAAHAYRYKTATYATFTFSANDPPTGLTTDNFYYDLTAGWGIEEAAPILDTAAASSVEATTATLNGEVTTINDTDITERGFVWDTSSHGDPGNVAPASSGYANNWTEVGTFIAETFDYDAGTYNSGTTYYVRACAENDNGNWGYGDEVTFLTKPAAPTNVAASDGTYTDKVTITWTKSTGATGYKVYEGSNLLDTLGDVATYNDTAAPAPTITAGSTVATDGDSPSHVALSLSGTSTNNGTSRTYKVVAFNATGNSSDSSTNAGYRGVGSLTYQWQKSAADSNTDYSNIVGATSSTHNDTAAPAPTITAGTAAASDGTSQSYVTLSLSGETASNGEGRYYKCVLDAEGAEQATSAYNRGYRGTTTLTYQWQRSAADSDADYSAIDGGTTDPYNDTGAPSDGSGRYFKCVVSMTGATPQTSTADRGYRIATPDVDTDAATSIEATTATGNGEIVDLRSGGNCTRRGFKWGTSTGVYGNDVYEDGDFGIGTYTLSLTSLPTGTTIYYIAYATSAIGTGEGAEVTFLTKPAAPTNVAATDGTYSNKVTITWTKATGATGYKVYEGSNLLDTLGNVATYDDTAASAPTITPGTAAASDGTSYSYVTLSLSGESASNGSSRTYKVVAFNDTGNSADSSTDTGYKGTTTLTYQWQRSAADSDADYSNISGAVTDPFNDTSAPSTGNGRYFKCVVSMTGATSQTSTADRGYRIAAPIHYILTGKYGTGLRPNFIAAIGKDDDGNPIYGDATDNTQIALGGYQFQILSASNITESMQSVADGLLTKIKREQKLSSIVTPPNCGLEQWDVYSIKDDTCGIDRNYRVSGYDFTYNVAGGVWERFQQILYLIDV